MNGLRDGGDGWGRRGGGRVGGGGDGSTSTVTIPCNKATGQRDMRVKCVKLQRYCASNVFFSQSEFSKTVLWEYGTTPAKPASFLT